MPSPFPGMDPYLEAHWGDVHSSLILYSRDVLRGGLPGSLYARVEERIVVERFEEVIHRPIPDVRIVEYPGVHWGRDGKTAVIDAEAPLLVTLPDEEVTETFIEIRDAGSGHRVVTVIEFLSPTNKRPGNGREQYLQKAESLRGGRVSLVEIDLLRAGLRGLAIPDSALSERHQTPYRAVVKRGYLQNQAEVYPIPLRARLPIVHIPLRESDADVPLDLQRVFEQTYDNGNYALTTDYSLPPSPSLAPEDVDWASQLPRPPRS